MACFEGTAPPEVLEASRHVHDVVRRGKCKYCGAPAVAASGGLSIPGVKEEHLELWCEQCGRDLVEFNSRPENAIPDFPFDDEAEQERVAQQLAERERRQQEYMRQKVRERQQ